jgi:hypothetical protein
MCSWPTQTDVKQMALWELASPPISDLSFVELQTVDVASGRRAQPYYVSLATGRLSTAVDRFAAPRGGILCEEMGFGKTVCVLALILATKSQRADVPEGIRVETSWLRPPTDHGPLDIPFGRVLRLTDLAAHRLLSSPFQSIHPSALEAGSALPPGDRDYLNLLEFGSQQPYYWAPSREMRGRMGANDVCREVPILLGWASLVIVPDNLLLQVRRTGAAHQTPQADPHPTRDSILPQWKGMVCRWSFLSKGDSRALISPATWPFFRLRSTSRKAPCARSSSRSTPTSQQQAFWRRTTISFCSHKAVLHGRTSGAASTRPQPPVGPVGAVSMQPGRAFVLRRLTASSVL